MSQQSRSLFNIQEPNKITNNQQANTMSAVNNINTQAPAYKKDEEIARLTKENERLLEENRKLAKDAKNLRESNHWLMMEEELARKYRNSSLLRRKH